MPEDMKKNRIDKINETLMEICPDAVNMLRDLIENPNTPVSSKVQLIGMILDRVLGKAETPLKVTTTAQENIEMAEARLQEIIQEIREEYEIQ